MSLLKTTSWQPTIVGARLRLRPLEEGDFASLHQAASDPMIWEQHPERDRFRLEKFTRYFRAGIECGGALIALDRATGRVLGSSRYRDHDSGARSIEIGYTFLVRDVWGTGANAELKYLMLSHAFQFVETVLFVVGESNHRSRRAVEKLGGVISASKVGTPQTSVVYRLERTSWRAHWLSGNGLSAGNGTGVRKS